MNRTIRGNAFDSSEEIKEVSGALKDLLTSQKDNIGILRVIVTEIQNSRNSSHEFLVEIKHTVDENQDILIGTAVDEVGGIKKDVKEIISILKARTPWWVLAGGIATVVGIFSTMLGMLLKLAELSKVIANLPK